MVGAFALQTGLTNGLYRYLRPSMRPWVVLAGIGLATIALVVLVPELARRMRRRPPTGAHEHPVSRIGWFLALPVCVAVTIGPPALGAFAAGRGSTLRDLPEIDFDLDAYLTAASFGGQVPDVRVVDFVVGAEDDETAATLAVQPVRLTGFVVKSDHPHEFRLVRFLVSCCAGDALPTAVVVRTDAAIPPEDTWVTVSGTLDRAATAADTESFAAPVFRADELDRIEAPDKPYEFPT